jgi:hypothetical protein
MLAGDLDGAERDSQLVLDNLRDVEGVDRADIAFFVQCGLIRLKCMRGDLDAAREHLALAQTYRTSIPMSARGHRMAALKTAEAVIDELSCDLDQAQADLAEALRHAAKSTDQPLLAGVGERIARVLMLLGDRQAEAACVLGASASLRGILDQGDPDIRDTIEALVEQLGEDGYAKAFRAGRELDRAAATLRLYAAVGISPE